MDYWGVKSHENDEAVDALDAGFDRVHGATYEALMDDDSPLTYDQVQEKLANAATLAASLDALRESAGVPAEQWDEVERLACAGVVVRHAEAGVVVPDEWRLRAIEWLEHEAIEWHDATLRRLRRDKEIGLLRGAGTGRPSNEPMT